MEIYVWLLLIGLGAYAIKTTEQRQRIVLLGSYLQKYQLEKLMRTLTDGYLRALGENDAERRQQIWSMLASTEILLCGQIERLALAFSAVDEQQARVSKLPLALPLVQKLLPGVSFDLRKALAIHAHGIARAAQNQQADTLRDKAFTLSAELFLFQHTCHWYCRSKAVASARMLARHQTTYAQLLAAVSPDTREAYRALVAG
ncbi:hypothetical protein [Hydrogenophaga sp.]|uniref:hypothetical protein n=1 Tax=Hydrogenophaga sp. TaxID=1904254 RepID=UPI00356A51EF